MANYTPKLLRATMVSDPDFFPKRCSYEENYDITNIEVPVSTDTDISTLLMGTPEILYDAVKDMWAGSQDNPFQNH